MQARGNQTAYVIASAARAPGGVISWAEARALYLAASAEAGVPHSGFRRYSYSSPLRALLARHFVQVIPDADEGTQPTSMARSLFVLKSSMEIEPDAVVDDAVELAIFQAENETDGFGMSTGQRRDPIDVNLSALKFHVHMKITGFKAVGLKRMSETKSQEEA